MLLPGMFVSTTAESTDGKRLTPIADSALEGEATGFGQLFSELKVDLMPASAPVSMSPIPMPIGQGEAGQGLPVERQSPGFQGIRLLQQPLLDLQISLTDLSETVDQLLSLDPEQHVELSEFLRSELGLTEVQQEDLFELFVQWQETPPTVALDAIQLGEAGEEGLAAVEELQEVMELLNEELMVWLNTAKGGPTVADYSEDRLALIRENPYLSQWLLGESRPGQGAFTAADWLAQTMQQLMKSASSGSIPLTLEPMRPEALMLTTVESEPAQQSRSLDLDLLAQSRHARTETRMDSQPAPAMEGLSLTPERGQPSPLAEAKPVAPQTLEQLHRPVPMAQTSQVLTERLVLMIQNEVNQATIRLDPPELGMMDIRIQVQNDQTQVQILVQTPQVREALESQSTRLREFLEQQGLALGDLDVTDQQQQNERQNEDQQDGTDVTMAQSESGSEQSELLEKQTLGLVDHFV